MLRPRYRPTAAGTAVLYGSSVGLEGSAVRTPPGAADPIRSFMLGHISCHLEIIIGRIGRHEQAGSSSAAGRKEKARPAAGAEGAHRTTGELKKRARGRARARDGTYAPVKQRVPTLLSEKRSRGGHTATAERGEREKEREAQTDRAHGPEPE